MCVKQDHVAMDLIFWLHVLDGTHMAQHLVAVLHHIRRVPGGHGGDEGRLQACNMGLFNRLQTIYQNGKLHTLRVPCYNL